MSDESARLMEHGPFCKSAIQRRREPGDTRGVTTLTAIWSGNIGHRRRRVQPRGACHRGWPSSAWRACRRGSETGWSACEVPRPGGAPPYRQPLSLLRSPQAKKAALEKAGMLNVRSVAEALRRDLGNVVPELRRTRQTVNERTAADRAGNLGVCLRHYRHDDAKETRCGSTSPR
jgi:hypothetical protein